MATRTQSKAPTNNTDANFRLWINEFHNAKIAAGWVDTLATGGINLATVTRPTAAATKKGFKVYRMGDTLQSTSPLFVRVEFGSDLAYINGVGLWITLGTQHDGLGNLAGNVVPEFNIYSYTDGVTTLYNCISSGTSSRFSLSMFDNAPALSHNFHFFVERIKNDDGTDSDKGFVFGMYCYQVKLFGCLYKEGTGSYYANNTAVVACPITGNGVDGADLGIYPMKIFKGIELNNPTVAVFFIENDITKGTTFVADMYGVSRTFRALNNTYPASVRGDIVPAMLWE